MPPQWGWDGVVDMRSDTVTRPSEAMRAAMAAARVGDDVMGEDPTVIELQNLMARESGKEAALFVPSGTMGNLIAVGAHCARGEEVILGQISHVYKYEAGGASALLGVTYATVPNADDGTISLDDIRSTVKEDDPHYPVTRMVSLENTHNFCGGKVLTSEYTRSVGALCTDLGLISHVDAARIFNAAAAMDTSITEMLAGVDSASICLSKGLGAPVGSVIVGSSEFIHKAARLRKMVGGGMRQCGVLAAAGIVAVEGCMPQLKRDHLRAKRLATGLTEIEGLFLGAEVETNIVLLGVDPDVIDPADFCEKMGAKGVRITHKGGYGKAAGSGSQITDKKRDWSIRAVVHLDVDDDMIDHVIASARDVIAAT